MKKITYLLFAYILIISITPIITFASNAHDDAIGGFRDSPRIEYTADIFVDVDENAWYSASIMHVYELGIMSGKGDRMFDPFGSVLVSEAVAMAARVHSIYNGGSADFATGTPWYQVYVNYAIENRIIQAGDFSDYNKMATRAEMVYIFSNSVPVDELAEINTIEALPDVTETARFGQNVYRLYRAGVLTGNDGAGTFTPDANITRAQAAAIIVRVVIPSERRIFSIDAPVIAPDNNISFQIDTIAANLFEFRSMVIDNNGIVYYLNDGIIYNSADNRMIRLSSDLIIEKDGYLVKDGYLAYDRYRDIVYLLGNESESNRSHLAGGSLIIYDISDFSNPRMVMSSENCPALNTYPGAGRITHTSNITPQIAVLENGSLIIPYHLDGARIVNPSNMTVIRTAGMYFHAYGGYKDFVIGNTAYRIRQGESHMVARDILTNESMEINIQGEMPHTSFASSGGLICFWSEDEGFVAIDTSGNRHIIAAMSDIKILDYVPFPRNIWAAAVNDSMMFAFYDNTAKSVRILQKAI